MGCNCSKDVAGSQPNRKSQYEIIEKSGKGNANEGDLQDNNKEKGQGSSSMVKQKKPKYIRTEEDKQLQQVYLHPEKLVELSINNEKEFINTVKKLKLKNLYRFKGYQVDPQLTLASGRKINTILWNPMTFALVMNKQNIYNFIIKEANFNLKKLLELERENNGNIGGGEQIHHSTEDLEQEGIVDTIKLMIENNSTQLLQKVFNDLAFLFKSYHIKKLIHFIMQSNESQKLLEMLLSSRAFIIVYVQKVKTISSQKYKGSFEFFLEKYFSNFKKDLDCQKAMAKVFVNAPFNVGFGTAIILNYSKLKQTFENLDSLIGKCQDLKDFDVYRMGGRSIGELDFKQMERNISQEIKAENQQVYNKFVISLRNKVENNGKVENIVQEILKSAQAGDLNQFKKKLGSLDMSKETIFQIQGLKGEDYKVEIQSLQHTQEFQLQDLNPLELSCVFGHIKILQYLNDEQGLKSQKEFQISKKLADNGGQLEKMPFILAPIFKKDAQTLAYLLNQTNLWNYEDFCSILMLLKQTKWFEGFQIALKSKLAHELFLNRTLQLKFRFVRDILIFPFKIDIQGNDDSDMSGVYDDDQQKEQMNGKKNTLSQDEKVQLRKIIKNEFCQEPYIGAFLFQEYAQRRDTYKDIAEMNDVPENFQDQLEYLRQCVNKISEMDMNDYILETQGGIVNILENVIRISISQEESEQKRMEVVSYEIEYLLDKINDHAAMIYLKEKNARAADS